MCFFGCCFNWVDKICLDRFLGNRRSVWVMAVLLPFHHLRLGMMPIAKNTSIKINILQIDPNKLAVLLCQYSAKSNNIFHYDSIIGHFRTAQNSHRKKTATVYLCAKFVGQFLKRPEDITMVDNHSLSLVNIWEPLLLQLQLQYTLLDTPGYIQLIYIATNLCLFHQPCLGASILNTRGSFCHITITKNHIRKPKYKPSMSQCIKRTWEITVYLRYS